MPRPGPLASLLLALSKPRGRAIAWACAGASAAALLYLVFQNAWVAEDAFITFRTVDQFAHGNGLRWNIDERVQVYTHPLWMFANIPLYAIFGDVATSATMLGLLCTLATYMALCARYASRPLVLLLGIFLPLAASTAVQLYATSGFENSMSFLCLAVYGMLLLRWLDQGETPWFRLALVGSLAVVNRLDTVLFYVPPMLFVMLSQWRQIRWGRFLVGYLPIVAWLFFSTFYYGFPYPNTALAKLNEEFPRYILVRQGLFYVIDLLWRDPAGFLTLLLGTVLTFTHLARALLPGTADRRRALGTASLGLGLLLYCTYVVWIGGSFLSRRHWTVPIVGSAMLIAEALLEVARGVSVREGQVVLDAAVSRALRSPALWIGTAALALLAGVVLVRGPEIQPRYLAERLFPDSTKKERPRSIMKLPVARQFLDENLEWRTSRKGMIFVRRGERIRAKGIGQTTTIGMTAMTAGRETIVIDEYALSDPLLARLPPKGFRMAGHFRRIVPDGYTQYRVTGSLERMDPDLRAYYEPLRLMITGPLFNWKRIRAIWDFNLGRYDAHRDAYVATQKREKFLADVERLREAAEQEAEAAEEEAADAER